jgi:casein kinase II subunit alpha
LFLGRDNPHQLVKITRVMGTDGLFEYMDKYGIDLNPKEHKNLKP